MSNITKWIQLEDPNWLQNGLNGENIRTEWANSYPFFSDQLLTRSLAPVQYENLHGVYAWLGAHYNVEIDLCIEPIPTCVFGNAGLQNSGTYNINIMDGNYNILNTTSLYISMPSPTDQDMIPPTFIENKNIVTDAFAANGAAVKFDIPIAQDNSGIVSDVICSHKSGDFFPIGSTTVMCLSLIHI